MPRAKGCDAIYEVANQWRDRCLADTKSLLWPEEETWTVENIDRLKPLLAHRREGEPTDFSTLVARRLGHESAAVRRLAADVIGVWPLMINWMTTESRLKWVLAAAPTAEPESVPGLTSLIDAYESGIAGIDGGNHHTRRAEQLQIYLDFARRIHSEEISPHDPTKCKAISLEIIQEYTYGLDAPNMYLHLLFPNIFEPITLRSHKQMIIKRLGKDRAASSDLDEALSQIRHELREKVGRDDFTFYDDDVKPLWLPAGSDTTSQLMTSDHLDLEGIAALFQDFRSHGGWNLGVRLRQIRAGHIRSILSKEPSISLDAFNREVWLLDTNSKIRSSGKKVGNIENPLSIEGIVEIERALQTDDLELHGNFVWRPSTGIFGAQLEASQRLPSVHRAIAHLADPDLTPLQKAKHIADLPGFGESTATGLVMLQHPSEFVIYNKQSQAALRSLGIPFDSLESFQEAAAQLRDTLGATDFLELDAFLFLIAQGQIQIPPGEPNEREAQLVDLVRAVHMDPRELESIEALTHSKKQIIFEGPPGSGKTYIADLFARYLTGNPLSGEHDERIEIVQFHQSYGYEDFVQGIRPRTDPVTGQIRYDVVDGIFLEMCKRARNDPGRTYVLIIDEINRGNVSRIFGELLMLLEYRGKRVRLPFGGSDGSEAQAYLRIPDNLYLIGTMNSTDRSLAMIDYALRRRFFFYRMIPVVDGRAPVFEKWLANQESIPDQDRDRLLRTFIALNRQITDEHSADFQIGHSYFMQEDIHTAEGLRRVWHWSLAPLLQEYYHGFRDTEGTLKQLEQTVLGPPSPTADETRGLERQGIESPDDV